jgi:hypothetical protein
MQEQLFMQATSQFLALVAKYLNQSFVPLAYILFSHYKGDFLTHPLEQSFRLMSSIENGSKPFRHSQGFKKFSW